MRNRQRGVALVWLIVLIILMIGAVIFGWVQASNASKLDADLNTARVNEQAARTALDEQVTKFREFSELVGCREANQNLGTKDLATKAVEDLKKTLEKGLPADAKTIEDLARHAASTAVARAQEIDQKEAQITELKGQVSAKEKAIDTTRQELQRQIDEERSRARDQATNDAARVKNLEDQLNQKITAAKEAADRLTAAQEAAEREKSDAQKKYDLVAAKNADLAAKLAFTREAPTSKGEVIEVSDALPIAYINLGDGDRLVAGMRFEVVDYDSNQKFRSKGWAEVTKIVSGKMSEVRLESRYTTLPISRGDMLLNPLFDPKGTRKAVLVGQFPISAGGRKGVEARLKDLGIAVGEKVDTTTDYLILGAPEVSNTGEKQDLDSHPEVIAAGKLGTLRYSLKELEGYFRRG